MKKTDRVYPSSYVKASKSKPAMQIYAKTSIKKAKQNLYEYLSDNLADDNDIPYESFNDIVDEAYRLIMESDFEMKNYPQYWYSQGDADTLLDRGRISEEAYNELYSGEFPDDFLIQAGLNILGYWGSLRK